MKKPDLFLDFNFKNNNMGLPTERELLIREIKKAKAEWKAACQKLDDVTEVDQIDYAIFALGAAEKRYEMLIRQAKKENLNLLKNEQDMED